ncbi:MAG: serine O-acetyltransferase [Syntrophaceae bacterium]|nr:serine O-acetyltransferase [Syntrophaceae bacterium]
MNLYATIKEDIRTVFLKDPAARSVIEVLTCYPGLHSIWMHRLAHALWRHRFFFVGRLVSHVNRFLTGIEIHPGARIGRRFFIDHGSGVVIGETTEIGDDVHLYQGVVLGGVSRERKKRHPTIRNGVMIGAGAIVLGPVTIGNDARVGAASLVIGDVPPRAIAVGVPARVGLGFSGKDIAELTDNRLPDPVAEAFRFLSHHVETLEARLLELEKQQGITVEINGSLEEDKREVLRIFSPFDEEFTSGAGI